MDVGSPLVAYLFKRRQRVLHHPTIPPQLPATLFALPSYPALGTAPPQGLSALLGIVGLVGVQLLGSLARSTPWATDRRYGVHYLFEHLRVVRRVPRREREAS